MAPTTTHGNGSQVLVVGNSGGVTLIDPSTPLRRLNYFDGQFLRANDFDVEQRYQRQLVAMSNQGLGAGVVYGYDTTLGSGDTIEVGPGLAVDPSGHVLLLQSSTTQSIQELIDASRRPSAAATPATGAGAFSDCIEIAAPPPATVVAVSDVYVIAICAAEALCGQADVFGKLCEEACVTSTDRPYRLDGVVLRAIPLQLVTPFPTSKAVSIGADRYLRSKVASSWFADEGRRHPDSISRAGLLSDVWCHGAGYDSRCCEVPLAVVARSGSTTLFLDAWIVRRERIDVPPKRYWQWTMRMRPLDVYLAQILQFQCQLADVLSGVVTPGGRTDPCASQHATLNEAAQFIDQVRGGLATSARRTTARATVSDRPALLSMSLAQVSDLRDRIQRLIKTAGTPALATDRILIQYGILATPAAAYLPVMTGTSVSVNDQVRALLGDGVDLRFCIVRPDYVAHALEEAQHMERISLIEGLDNPSAKPQVDVLVPFGKIATDVAETGRYYEMRLNLLPQNLVLLAVARTRGSDQTRAANVYSTSALSSNVARGAVFARASSALETFEYSGAAHSEPSSTGGTNFYYAGTTGTFTLGTTQATRVAVAPPTNTVLSHDSTAPAATTSAAGAAGTATAVGAAAAATAAASGAAVGSAGAASTARLGDRIVASAAAVGAAPPQLRSSVWVSLETARDPADLQRGEAMHVGADLTVLLTEELQSTFSTSASAAQATRSILMRAIFTGEFQVADNEVRPGTQEVREIGGVVSGELSLSYREGTQPQSLTLYLSEDVRILRTAGPHGPSFRVEWVRPSVLQPLVTELEVRREWKSAAQAEALGTMTFAGELADATTTRKAVTRETFRAWQTINATVREPNHPAHESAIRALRTIGTALGAGKFADLAARRLFPAPPPTTDLTIIATEDWVLFHRRRDKVCRGEITGPAVETRRYALYQIELTANQTVADLAKLFQRTGTRAESLPPLNFVQLVEFDAGIHAVASPYSQVQAGWRQDVGPDGTIAGGLVASRGVAVAEGERLAQERLEALVEVLGVVAPIDVHPDYAVLTRVPDALDVVTQDGIMVVATRRAATSCHEVIAVDTVQAMQALAAAARQGVLGAALTQSKVAVRLGSIDVTAGGLDQAGLQSVVTKWNGLTFGKAATAIVVAAASDPQSANYSSQSTAILSALGAGGAVPEPIATTTLPSTCGAITIVAGSVATRNALLVYGQFEPASGALRLDAAPGTMEFRDNAPQGDSLVNYLNGLTNRVITGVTLSTVKAAPDPGATARLNAVTGAMTAAGRTPLPTTALHIEALTAVERTGLQKNSQNPDNFDDIVFLSDLPIFL